MPLKIIGAGFGRTGTMSTFVALKQLGYPCYHMVEVLENKANRGHLAFWHKVARDPPGTPQDWEQVFGAYTATVDNPACCVWRELLAAYPEARVLLTLHPKGAAAWYESTMSTIYFTETLWQWKVLEWLTPFGRRFGDMSRRLIWQRTLRGTMSDEARAVARYEAWIEEIRAAVPPERLLVFRVTEGWEPLCRFLGVPVPDTPFPSVNDRAEVMKLIHGIIRGAYGLLALSTAAGAALVYGAWRLFG